ncbi:MAG: hypothetical protein JWP03_4222, partial [Phycisphaerales bacterium]|nr:hypothetical protein [Phycisphaerales bacterium]
MFACERVMKFPLAAIGRVVLLLPMVCALAVWVTSYLVYCEFDVSSKTCVYRDGRTQDVTLEGPPGRFCPLLIVKEQYIVIEHGAVGISLFNYRVPNVPVQMTPPGSEFLPVRGWRCKYIVPTRTIYPSPDGAPPPWHGFRYSYANGPHPLLGWITEEQTQAVIPDWFIVIACAVPGFPALRGHVFRTPTRVTEEARTVPGLRVQPRRNARSMPGMRWNQRKLKEA